MNHQVAFVLRNSRRNGSEFRFISAAIRRKMENVERGVHLLGRPALVELNVELSRLPVPRLPSSFIPRLFSFCHMCVCLQLFIERRRDATVAYPVQSLPLTMCSPSIQCHFTGNNVVTMMRTEDD